MKESVCVGNREREREREREKIFQMGDVKSFLMCARERGVG